MRIFKTKWFAKFARNEGISDGKLLQTVRDIETGNFDADLGGGVFKQRISRPGEGKSGGYRTIIIYRQDDVAFCVYGFAKSARSNINKHDVKNFKKLADTLLALSVEQIEAGLKKKEFLEVNDEKSSDEENEDV